MKQAVLSAALTTLLASNYESENLNPYRTRQETLGKIHTGGERRDSNVSNSRPKKKLSKRQRKQLAIRKGKK